MHGHLHEKQVMSSKWKGVADERYLNVSVERINGIPMSFDELRKFLDDT